MADGMAQSNGWYRFLSETRIAPTVSRDLRSAPRRIDAIVRYIAAKPPVSRRCHEPDGNAHDGLVGKNGSEYRILDLFR